MTHSGHAAALPTARKPNTKTTVYVDDELLRTVRVLEARSGRSDSDVFEAALRRYVGLDLLDRVWSRSSLDADEAGKLANDELRALRREKHAPGA